MKRKPDRVSIDLVDLRSRIEAFRSDPAWKNLSLGGKIRALIEIALNGAEQPANQTIATLIKDYWEDIVESDLDISVRRLKTLASGDRPTDDELIQLGSTLPYSTEQLSEIRDRTFKKRNGNGCSDPAKV